LFFTMVGLAACGDDENDIKPPDASTTPDAAKPVFKEYDANEGGEVRIEYVRFGGGNAGTRAGAFFYDNAGSTKFWPYINLTGCNDTSTDMQWPVAASPIAERTYLDPGAVIVNAGAAPFSIPRNTTGMPAVDVPGRAHPANQWFFKNVTGASMDGPTFLSEKLRGDVIVTGGPNMPAQVFDKVMFMPADFQVIDPPLSATPFPIPADTAQTFTWQNNASMPPTGYSVQSLVAFIVPGQGPAVICVEPNDGSITVPANMINVARAKGATTLARQTLTHVVRELMDRNGPTGKRIDFLTIWCYATPLMIP
jgi:hypothetical protein